ncbi:MAG: hypothetical protein ACOH16_08600 [Propionibacteriaceae bacterium]
MVNVTLDAADTWAASSLSVTSWLILAIIPVIRDCTISADGPLAWTINAGSEKLEAHWPPVSGRKTVQPS